MEEAPPADCGGLLQLACRGDRNHTDCSYWIPCLAVGTRWSEGEGHSSDASSNGVRVELSDLGSMVHPHENPPPTRRVAPRISLADRGGGRSVCRRDRALGWFSKWSEWTWIKPFKRKNLRNDSTPIHPVVNENFHRVLAVYSDSVKLLPICFVSFLSLFTRICLAQSGATSEPEANPGRPTVSTPAALTPAGYLQFENGTLFAEHSTEFSKRIGISQVTKLAVFPRLELLLQSEPLTISGFQGQTAVHEGEVFAGAQALLLSGGESRPTVAISYIWRIHASVAPELDVGTFRQSTAILLSKELRISHRYERDSCRTGSGLCT